jgi:hypothetical protein
MHDADEIAIELRAVLSATLRAALPLVSDNFTIQLLSSQMELPYVQGCVEDENLLEVEISAPTFTDLAVVANGHQRLMAKGWSAPEDDAMPNYWQVVNTALMTWDEITDLVVGGLDDLYDLFQNLPQNDLGLGVELMPLELAARAWPDGLDVDQVRFPGEEATVPVTIPDDASGLDSAPLKATEVRLGEDPPPRDLALESSRELLDFIADHEGRGFICPVEDSRFGARHFQRMTLSIEPTDRGPMAVVCLEPASGYLDENDTDVVTRLELHSRPEPHEWMPAWWLHSTEGRFLVTAPHLSILHREDPECAVEACRRNWAAMGNSIESASWQIAVEIARTDPRIRIFRTHPGGGQYDCLTLLGAAAGISINRVGSIHWDHSRNGREGDTVAGDEWQARVLAGVSPRVIAEEVCARAGLPWPKPRPSTQAHTLAYRVIAHSAERARREDRPWRAATQFLDSSGGFGGSMRPPLSADMSGIAGNYLWIAGMLDQPPAWFWDGWVWTSSGERRDLLALHRAGASLDDLVDVSFVKPGRSAAPPLPEVGLLPTQPDPWWPKNG